VGKLIAEAAERFGKLINVASKQKTLMEAAGFTEVHEEVYKVRTSFLPIPGTVISSSIAASKAPRASITCCCWGPW
jgi:hypothetical protein